MYTNSKLTDMVLDYEEALLNADAARRFVLYEYKKKYMERFPDRQVPRAHTFVNAVQHYGTFNPINRDRGRSRSRRVLDLEPEILQAVEKKPNVIRNRSSY
jgi:hypothetical protein